MIPGGVFFFLLKEPELVIFATRNPRIAAAAAAGAGFSAATCVSHN
jgi:hypothetical protein